MVKRIKIGRWSLLRQAGRAGNTNNFCSRAWFTLVHSIKLVRTQAANDMSELVADRMAADSSGAVESDSPKQTSHGAAENLFQGGWMVKRPQ